MGHLSFVITHLIMNANHMKKLQHFLQSATGKKVYYEVISFAMTFAGTMLVFILSDIVAIIKSPVFDVGLYNQLWMSFLAAIGRSFFISLLSFLDLTKYRELTEVYGTKK